MYKRFFVKTLENICLEFKIDIKSFCDDWLLEFYHDQKFITRTIGYNFDLNSSISQALVSDKVLTSQVLRESNLQIVEHYILYGDFSREKMFLGSTLIDDVRSMNIVYPIVIKPNNGTSGKDIFLINNLIELKFRIFKIAKYNNIAICKYVESKYEYRFYILDERILLTYKKSKDKDWRHNLSLGAKPSIINSNLSKYKKLTELAKSAFLVSGLKVGVVDILETKDGYMILEINSGIAMDNFAITSIKYEKIAINLHRELFIETIKGKI